MHNNINNNNNNNNNNNTNNNGIFNTCFRTRVKYSVFTLITFPENFQKI